jgi:hypothetical protein
MSTTPQTVTHSTIRAELFDIARELIADGFAVYYLPDMGAALTRWIIFGKADESGTVHTGTVQIGQFGGYDVDASIKPTRQYGSSMAMWLADGYQDYQQYDSVLDACRAAARPEVRNFMHVTLKNDGIQHFKWCADRLISLTA